MDTKALHNYMNSRTDAQVGATCDFKHTLVVGDFSKGVADFEMSRALGRFMHAIYDKAKRAQEKYGFGELGWAYPDWQQELQKGIAGHLLKGDPRDVAIYSFFAWYHDWPTAAASPAPAAAPAAGVVGDAVGEAYQILSIIDDLDSNLCDWSAEKLESNVRQLRQFVMDTLATPPAPGPGAAVAAGEAVGAWQPGDREAVEAVRESAETHEGLYISSKVAKRLLRLIGTPTPPTTGAAAAPAAGAAS